MLKKFSPLEGYAQCSDHVYGNDYHSYDFGFRTTKQMPECPPVNEEKICVIKKNPLLLIAALSHG